MENNFNIGEVKMMIGLGNPEGKYLDTYHNAGRLFVEYLKENSPLPDVELAVTGCSMNASGRSVREILEYHNLKPKDLVLAHDDSDLKLGQYKLSFGRGSAGHKGIESVISHLKTNEFWRLRIGIRPEEFVGKSEKFVLKKIAKEHKKILEETFSKIYEFLAGL